jgi:hypothetical protein
MKLMIYYVVFALGGSAAVALACIAIETYFLAWLGLPLFLSTFFLILWGAWVLAVRLSEPKAKSAPIVGAASEQRA